MDAIVQQLAGLYHELVTRQTFSEVARVELSTADASGQVSQLLICQCDCHDLQLVSMYCRWWVVDSEGIHADAKWPLTNAMRQQASWMAEFPVIKFATDGRRVRFGMEFGPDWYVVKEGPVGIDGRFVSDELVELFHSLRFGATASESAGVARPRPRYSPFFLLSLVQFLLIVAFPMALHGYARAMNDRPEIVGHARLDAKLFLVPLVGFVVWVPAAVTTGNALRASRGKSISAWMALALVAIPCLPFLRNWYDFLVSR